MQGLYEDTYNNIPKDIDFKNGVRVTLFPS